MKQILSILVCSFIILFTSSLVLPAEKTMLLGFIESVNEKEQIRITFIKKKGGWESLCSDEISSPTDCRIDNGHNQILWYAHDTNISPMKFLTVGYTNPKLYSNIGVADLPHGTEINWSNPPTYEYSGWADRSHKPLTVTNYPLIRSAPIWVKTETNDDIKRKIIKAFRELIPAFPKCYFPDKNTVKFKSQEFRNKDILIEESYKSVNNAWLLTVRLNPDLNNCFGPPDDNWSTMIFYVDRSDRVSRIDFSRRNKRSSVDVKYLSSGDFDGDGHYEVLFWYTGYNDDGYVLFQREFREVQVFSWFYH